MKKLIIVLSALLMTLSSLSAEGIKSGKTITKDYNLTNFTGIVASGIYDVQLEKSNTCKVTISVPEELEDYLDVKVNNGKLVLAMKQVPLRVSRHFDRWTITAKVAIPTLKSLSLSGATKFVSNDTFDIGDGSFKLDLSGAAKANGLDIRAKELKMEMGGATSASISGDFNYADIEMGGAAKCIFEISADELHQELGGAAKAYHSGNFAVVELEASGACVFSFTGATEKMNIEGSGAAKIETSKGYAKDVFASVSGASYSEINATENLVVEASGGSSIRYVDNGNVKLDIREISRGSSVTKMR